MLRVTVDANFFHSLSDPRRAQHENARRLWRLHERGRIAIVAGSQTVADVPREPLRSRIRLLKVLAAAGQEAPAGQGAYATQEEAVLAARLMDTVFPGAEPASPRHRNRLADVEHLLAHLRMGNDCFLTDDAAILGQARKLRTFGIVALGFGELLARLEPGP